MNASLDKALGCLLAGLIGDAMGSPTEGKEPEEIERQFGWVEDFGGSGTDDSILKHILADALIASNGLATLDDWAAQIVAQRQLMRAQENRFFVSVKHMASKLQQGYNPKMASIGNMPSSSSAMCIAPVGIVNAGHPRAAAMQAEDLASLIHTGDVSFCQDAAAAIAAAIAAAFLPGADTASVLQASTAYLKPKSGAVMKALILDALALAREAADYRQFRAEYHARFRQGNPCDSRETVPAALALVHLAHGEPNTAIIYGANFGRDADTIATMVGAVCGALKGAAALPKDWVEKIEAACDRNQTELAQALIDVAKAKAQREMADWQAALSALTTA